MVSLCYNHQYKVFATNGPFAIIAIYWHFPSSTHTMPHLVFLNKKFHYYPHLFNNYYWHAHCHLSENIKSYEKIIYIPWIFIIPIVCCHFFFSFRWMEFTSLYPILQNKYGKMTTIWLCLNYRTILIDQ